MSVAAWKLHKSQSHRGAADQRRKLESWTWIFSPCHLSYWQQNIPQCWGKQKHCIINTHLYASSNCQTVKLSDIACYIFHSPDMHWYYGTIIFKSLCSVLSSDIGVISISSRWHKWLLSELTKNRDLHTWDRFFGTLWSVSNGFLNQKKMILL